MYSAIQIGDQLLAVNEVPLSIHKLPFDLALELLGSSARPVVLWFRRPVPGGDLPPGLSASGIIPTGTLSGEAEFKEAPPNATRNMVNPATTSSSPKQWACPKCTYKNRTYADSCSICTFSRRGADLFCVGDEVTWKGSDAELPAGTVRRAFLCQFLGCLLRAIRHKLHFVVQHTQALGPTHLVSR